MRRGPEPKRRSWRRCLPLRLRCQAKQRQRFAPKWRITADFGEMEPYCAQHSSSRKFRVRGPLRESELGARSFCPPATPPCGGAPSPRPSPRKRGEGAEGPGRPQVSAYGASPKLRLAARPFIPAFSPLGGRRSRPRLKEGPNSSRSFEGDDTAV